MPTQAGKALVPFEGDFSKLQSGAASAVSKVGGMFSGAGGAMAHAFEGVGRAASVAFVGIVAGAGAALLKMGEAAMRVEELNTVLGAVAKANNQSLPALQATVAAVKALGIETGVAQSTVIQFTRMQLNMADATKLARVAQDAAVISGQNSTDTLAQLVEGIQTQNVRVLRNAGINISAAAAEKEYAKQLGIATSALTPAQKQQAILNAVLQQGVGIQGAYLAALADPGKQLRSLPRLFNDIAVSLGGAFLPALGAVVTPFYHLMGAVDVAATKGKPLNDLFVRLGGLVSQLVAPLGHLADRAIAFVNGLTSGQVNGMFDKVLGFFHQFGPLIGGVAAAMGASGLASLPFIGGLLPHINPLLAGLGALIMLNPGLRAFAGTIANDLMGAMSQAWTWVVTNFGPAFISLGNWFQGPGLQALQGFGNWIAQNVVPALQGLGNWITGDGAAAFAQWADWFNLHIVPAIAAVWTAITTQIMPALIPLWSSIMVNVVPAVRDFVGGLADIFRYVVPIAAAIGGALLTALKGLTDNFAVLKQPLIDIGIAWLAWKGAQFASGLVADLADAVYKLGTKIGIAPLIDAAALSLRGLGTAVWIAASPIIAIAAPLAAIVAAIMWIQSHPIETKSALHTTIFGQSWGGAEGGTVKPVPGGTSVIVAEAGQEEDLVPADQRLSYALRQLHGLSAGGGGRTIAVTVNAMTNADPVEISRTAAWEIRRAIG